MDSLFEFLFKYRPLLYEQGELTLAASWPIWAVVGIGALIALVALVTYLPERGTAGPADRGVLAGLRVLALAVLILCLLQPALVLSSTVDQRNFVAVLVDDSRSMTVRDDEAPRSQFVSEAFGGTDGDLREALEERFALRFFRFGEGAGRIDDVQSLSFQDRATRLGPALDVVRDELEGVPLSGIVVLTDGSGAGGDDLQQALLRTRAADVPVYTVGLGRERIPRDIQVSRVEMPRKVLKGSSVGVDVIVTHQGFGERTVPLRVEEDGVLVAEETVTLPAGGEPAVVRLHLTPEISGPRVYRFYVPVQEQEAVQPNNQQEVLATVVDRREKILYIEGHPRFEVKFLRRAVADDELLQVVTLQRTAENKFLRLSVDDAEELAGGFPTTRQDLFRYRGIILGSVGAGFFTPDQLRMIADFVSQRGGSLLMLGGPESFAEGDYAGTPVADVLPVILEDDPSIGGSFLTELTVEATPAGEEHAALQLAPDTAGEARSFSSLPRLSTLNPVREVKPGATTLLVGNDAEVDEELVVLAWQRYGRGKSLALPVHDTWMWQMHADVPLEDLSHENFWRQLLRWMVDGVPDHLEVEAGGETVDPGRTAEVRFQLVDSAYLGVNDARVSATIAGPGGTETQVSASWTGEEDGVYRAAFAPTDPGLYRVQVRAEWDGNRVAEASDWIRAAPSEREFFDAGMNSELLERVAEETGGRFYTPATASNLAEDLQYTGSGVTVVEERDLWDMPALFLLMVLLVGAEWSYRRVRRLA
ncbi:MAG: glutamine amidotransferase [Longimicrobiales bacterium]|nr:glutamine amidotransferase [Longimicrobiales bacterium]